MHAGFVVAILVGVAALGGGAWAGMKWYETEFAPCGPAEAAKPYGEPSGLSGTIAITITVDGAPSRVIACIIDADGNMRDRWEMVMQPNEEMQLITDVPLQRHSVSGAAAGARFSASAEVPTCAYKTADINIFVDPNGATGIRGGCASRPMSASSSQNVIPAPAIGKDPLRPQVVAAGVAIALGAGALTWAALALRGFWTPAFTRLVRPRLLDHETRAHVHDAVLADPGIHAQGLVRGLELPESVVRYHLGVLRREGLLVCVQHRGRRHYFRAGHDSPMGMRRVAALRQDTAQRVQDFVERNPGRTVGQVATALSLSHSTIVRQSARLEELGLLTRRRDGRTVRLEARRG